MVIRRRCLLQLRSIFFFKCLIALLLLCGGVHAGEVSLVWKPSTDSEVAGYKVYCGESTDHFNWAVNVGNQTEAIIGELEEDENYHFIVKAYERSGKEIDDYVEEIEVNVPLNDDDPDGDNLSTRDEIFVYGTDPERADTDGDGIEDGDEVVFWVNAWGSDIDGDGKSNLLDADSDGDGNRDGVRIN